VCVENTPRDEYETRAKKKFIIHRSFFIEATILQLRRVSLEEYYHHKVIESTTIDKDEADAVYSRNLSSTTAVTTLRHLRQQQQQQQQHQDDYGQVHETTKQS